MSTVCNQYRDNYSRRSNLLTANCKRIHFNGNIDVSNCIAFYHSTVITVPASEGTLQEN